MNNSIDIFVDGSINSQAKTLRAKHLRKAGYGVYIVEYDIKMAEPFKLDNPTNNRAEYYACIKSMEWVIENQHTNKQINIYSDSELLINSLTIWLAGWIKRGWKTAQGQPVKNQDLLFRLVELKNQLRVKFIKVRSHQDEPSNKNSVEWYQWKGNDVADSLAKQGRLVQ